jgi:3-oxoacyl-[acyl-carrier protein] reductase
MTDVQTDPARFLNFIGHVVVITGAASGIGRACAELFYAAGACIAVADHDERGLASMLAGAGMTPDRVMHRAFDVTSFDACSDFADAVSARWGVVSALIPSAGVYRDRRITDMTLEQWRETMTVNIDGVFNIVKSVLPLLGNGSSITLLASRAAHCGGSLGHAHYGTTKGAMLAFARGLARELGPRVRVNAVSPGVIETPMTAVAISATKDEILAQTPLARLGSARDIAEAILFLSSPMASFVTGETIQVNGGLYMG